MLNVGDGRDSAFAERLLQSSRPARADGLLCLHCQCTVCIRQSEMVLTLPLVKKMFYDNI